MRYGDFNLRRGDHDGAGNNPPRWGGALQNQGNAQGGGNPQGGAGVAPNAGGAAGNMLNIPQHVRQLQDDLRELGFLVVPQPAQNAVATFDRYTEWGVREFQIYAKMTHVAEENPLNPAARYVDRLSRVANPDNLPAPLIAPKYTGPISGVVNEGTHRAIQHWLDNLWRCPVVVEAWNMQGGNRVSVRTANIWRHDEVGTSQPRMYARDFTHYYTFPQGRNADDMIVLGYWDDYSHWEGQASVPPRHTWDEAEVLPRTLVGQTWAQLNNQQQSTFRVIRAISEQECIGMFDCLTGYDRAFVSQGPCHWTIAIAHNTANTPRAIDEGELCGFLSYLRETDQAAFDLAIGFYGIRVNEVWNNDGVGLFSNNSRKYTGMLERQVETGPPTGALQMQWQRMPTAANQNAEDEMNYIKLWHWFYRFQMAGRTVAGYRQRMYHMARMRIRDVLRADWGGNNVAQVGQGPAARAARIGDVFTSERAVAMIVRMHVYLPGRVVSGGNAGSWLDRNNAQTPGALQAAQTAAPNLNWNSDPSTWGNDHETALINGIITAITARPVGGIVQSTTCVQNWPTWANNNPRGWQLNLQQVGNSLNDDRNSLQFDDAGLPPAPP